MTMQNLKDLIRLLKQQKLQKHKRVQEQIKLLNPKNKNLMAVRLGQIRQQELSKQ